MNTSFWGRALLAGLLLGASFYFFPVLFFPLRILAGVALFFALARLFFWGLGPGRGIQGHWHGSRGFGPGRQAFFDRVRSMTDAEYSQFTARFAGKCGHYGYASAPSAAAPSATEPIQA